MTSFITSLFPRIVRDEEGQTMVEYGLIIALISLAAVGVFTTIGADLLSAFTSIASNLP